MESFFYWLASSPIASALKVGLSASLGWVALNIDSLNIHPAIAIAVVSALPVLINWLNPADGRYGKGEE